MSPASEAQRAQMRRDVEAVEAQFLKGLLEQGFSLSTSAILLPLGALVDAFTGDTKRLVDGMEAERQTLVTWRTRWKEWAEAGKRDNGTAYSVEQWQEVGRSISRGIQFWTGVAISRNAFVLVKQAAKDTATTVESAAEAVMDALPPLPDKKDWERLVTFAKWGGGALLVTGLLVAAGYAVRSVK